MSVPTLDPRTRILILGATGRTGSHLVQVAIQKGIAVTCLARNCQRILKHPLIHAIEGNPGKTEDLLKALEGCTHVISVLNISRRSDIPWSRLRTPPTYLSDVMANLIPLAGRQAIQHISICSAWGVGDSRKDIPFWFRKTIDLSNIKAAYLDHERQEKILSASDLNWTIVRPSGLTNQSADQTVRESYLNQPKPGLLISRKAVASFLLESLFRKDLTQQTLTISKA